MREQSLRLGQIRRPEDDGQHELHYSPRLPAQEQRIHHAMRGVARLHNLNLAG